MKNSLKKLLSCVFCSVIALVSVGCVNVPKEPSSSNMQSYIETNAVSINLVKSNARYSVTSNEEEKALFYDLTTSVAPVDYEYNVNFSIDSASGGVFDDGADVNDYIEIIPNGNNAIVKVKQAFLNGVVTIKAETTNFAENVFDVCSIVYVGIPTDCKVLFNGETNSIDNPFNIYAGSNNLYTVTACLDNYFGVVQGTGSYENKFFQSTLFLSLGGVATAYYEINIDEKNYSFSTTSDFGYADTSINMYISADLESSGVFTEDEVSVLSLFNIFECNSRSLFKTPSSYTYSQDFLNGVANLSFSLISTDDLNFSGDIVEFLDDYGVSCSSASIKVTYDLSQVFVLATCEIESYGLVESFLSNTLYFNIIQTADTLNFEKGDIII